MSANQQQPDDLMDHFQGSSLKTIVIFTIIIHFVVILVTSIPFLIGKFAPNDKLSEEQRTKLAVKEANETLSKIAKTHGLQTQQLRNQMAGGRRPAPKATDKPEEGTDPTTDGSDGETPKEGEIRGDSDVENKLREKLDPPELPPVNDAEDLFK